MFLFETLGTIWWLFVCFCFRLQTYINPINSQVHIRLSSKYRNFYFYVQKDVVLKINTKRKSKKTLCLIVDCIKLELWDKLMGYSWDKLPKGPSELKLTKQTNKQMYQEGFIELRGQKMGTTRNNRSYL